MHPTPTTRNTVIAAALACGVAASMVSFTAHSLPLTPGEAALAPFATSSDAVPGEYIVRTATTESDTRAAVESVSTLTQRLGGTVLHRYNALGGVAARLTHSQLTELRRHPQVTQVFENGTRTLPGVSTDRQQPPPTSGPTLPPPTSAPWPTNWPRPTGMPTGRPTGRPTGMPTIPPFPEPKPIPLPDGPGTQSDAVWGLDRIDQRTLPLNRSYSYQAAGRGVNMYIMDTGVVSNHVEMAGRHAGGRGWSTVNGQFSDSFEDCSGHGTHVAGTAAGRTVGVARAASIYSLRIFNCQAKNEDKHLLAALDWALTHTQKPAVMNMSWGETGTAPVAASIDEAVKKLVASGITVVVAAGNSGADACAESPGRVPEVLTVGNTTDRDQYSPRSNHGKCVDIAAPGTKIRSAMYGTPSMYVNKSGTSMAAPHVAGAAALYLETHPQASPAEVMDAVLAAGTRGTLNDVPAGTPNVLLYTAQFPARPTQK